MKLSSIKHYKITTSLECYNENIDSITKIKIYKYKKENKNYGKNYWY